MLKLALLLGPPLFASAVAMLVRPYGLFGTEHVERL